MASKESEELEVRLTLTLRDLHLCQPVRDFLWCTLELPTRIRPSAFRPSTKTGMMLDIPLKCDPLVEYLLACESESLNEVRGGLTPTPKITEGLCSWF
jgi:hypothetical protein